MKNYVKPMMECEVFAANEYIAACFYGLCDTSGYVFEDNNSNGVIDSGDDYIYVNEACNSPYYQTGLDTPKPNTNVLVFDRDQVRWIGIPFLGGTYEVKDDQKDKGTRGWHWQDHVTTHLVDNDRPNHS